MDTSTFTGGMFSLLSSFLFWVVMAVLFVVVVFTFLIIRRGRKLTVPVIELTPLGRGKLGIKAGKKLKGGWLKHNSTFFGLWDYGHEDVFKLKDGRKILNISSEDYHEINGRMGVMAMRSPEDPRILVPISKSVLENGNLLNKIAPADYRGTVVDIIKKAEKETSDRVEKFIQIAVFAGLILFAFISIILIVQMVKNGQAESKDLILEAGRMNTDNLKAMCQGLQHVGEAVASEVAP